MDSTRDFEPPGGGLVNLDLLYRASRLPDMMVVILIDEGTFHQVHGGISPNAPDPAVEKQFQLEYEATRGHPFRTPKYQSSYFGYVVPNVFAVLRESIMLAPFG